MNELDVLRSNLPAPALIKLTVPVAPLSAMGAVMVRVLAAFCTSAMSSAPAAAPAVSEHGPLIVWLTVPGTRMPPSPTNWTLWSHVWRPQAPGRYEIVLRVNDPAVRTRRLDIFFYTREVEIDDV